MYAGSSTSSAASGGAGTPGQGYAGGKNVTGTGSTNRHFASGGGGGAGGPGGDAVAGTVNDSGTGGAAGIGAASDITGTSRYYAGGGAGAGTTNGSADATKAATGVGITPAANTGSGGAGSKLAAQATSGASGFIIVRYSPQIDKYWSRSSATEPMYTSTAGPIPTATTDSFTIEAWVRPTDQAANTFYGIMGQQTSAGTYANDRQYLLTAV
jgi:hypothetical protein